MIPIWYFAQQHILTMKGMNSGRQHYFRDTNALYIPHIYCISAKIFDKLVVLNATTQNFIEIYVITIKYLIPSDCLIIPIYLLSSNFKTLSFYATKLRQLHHYVITLPMLNTSSHYLQSILDSPNLWLFNLVFSKTWSHNVIGIPKEDGFLM